METVEGKEGKEEDGSSTNVTSIITPAMVIIRARRNDKRFICHFISIIVLMVP